MKEVGDRLPPYAQSTQKIPETEAERQTTFSQLQQRKIQARRKRTEERGCRNEHSGAGRSEDVRENYNEEREEEKRERMTRQIGVVHRDPTWVVELGAVAEIKPGGEQRKRVEPN